MFLDATGHMTSIPRGYTNLVAEDRWLAVAAGRSLLRLEDCFAMISWVHDVTPSSEGV